MMAHPNVVDVIPSLYGVFAVFAFQWTNVGTEKVAIRSSTVTALLRLVLHTSREMNKNKLCSNYYTTVLNTNLDNRISLNGSLLELADAGLYTRRLVNCDSSTTDTPYAQGLTAAINGLAIIMMSSTLYGTILYIPSAEASLFIISKTPEGWNSWEKITPDTNQKILFKTAIVDPAGNDYVDISIPGITSSWAPVIMNGDRNAWNGYVTGVHVDQNNGILRVYLSANRTGEIRINYAYLSK